MIFTKRERHIALATLLMGGLLVGYQYALTPFLNYRAEINDARAAVSAQVDHAQRLVNSRASLNQRWNALLTAGLKTTPSEAESQVLHAVRDWAQEAGVGLSSLKPERGAPVPEERFQEIGFHATGTGSMAALTRLLWRFETAATPIRINTLQITPRKEATDDLTVQLSLSTLCLNPEVEKPKPRPALREKETP